MYYNCRQTSKINNRVCLIIIVYLFYVKCLLKVKYRNDVSNDNHGAISTKLN